MAGFQFGHISTFSFKGNTANFSIDGVAAEAARLPGNHPHVAEPLPPKQLAGDFAPEQVPAEIRRRVAEAKLALKQQRAPDGKIQRIRDDTHVMEAQVHSHPIYMKAPPPEHEGEDRPAMDDPLCCQRYELWRSDLVRWIVADAQRRGLDLLCVVEHVDEAHPHIHALLVPQRTQLNPRMDAKMTHPGHAAQARRKAQARERLTSEAFVADAANETDPAERSLTKQRRGIDIGRRRAIQPQRKKAKRKVGEPANREQIINQIGTRAYKAAMRGWQSKLFDDLSRLHGLARVGPGLERLSRRAWWHRQTESEVVLGNKELALSFASVGQQIAEQTAKTDQRREQAEADTAVLHAEIKSLETKLLAANETIRRADELPQTIKSLERQEAAGRQRLIDVSGELSNASLILRQAEQAEEARKKAEQAALQAEERFRMANTSLAALEQRERLLKRERETMELRKVELDRREIKLQAMLRGLAAWTSGRLSITDNRLVILQAKSDRNPDEELAGLKPVEEWLVEKVRRLESIFNNRFTAALDDAKRVMKSTIKAWATGLIFVERGVQPAVKIRKGNPVAEQKLLQETSHDSELVQSTVQMLPDLTAVYEVLKRADGMRATLDEAEFRELRIIEAKRRALRGNNPDRS